jgi:predicted dehydrogenase
MNVPAHYGDFREMIDKENLDVVHICTPNKSHFEISMYALDHGVNVISEKPMTTTVAEAERIEAKVKETGLVFGLNFHNRFYPMTHHLHHMVRDGDLGEVFNISGSYTQDWLLFETDYSWRLNVEDSGKTRAIADIGSHWMDLAEFVSGRRITDVCADFQIIHKTRKRPKKEVEAYSTEKFSPDDYEDIPIHTEDTASVLFKFEGGAKGSAFISQVTAGKSVAIDLLVSGYKQSGEWYSESCNNLWIGRRDQGYTYIEKGPTTVHDATKPLIAYPLGHLEGFTDAFKQSFRQIYNSIDDPGAPRDYAQARDGLHEMKLCEAIFESNARQSWVRVE